MAKFIITEEQYKKLMNEDALNQTQGQVNLNIPGKNAQEKGENLTKELSNPQSTTGQMLNNTNISSKNIKLTTDATGANATGNTASGTTSTTTTTAEGRIITKKELTENHFKYLKENSKLYSVKDFLKR